MKLLNPRSFFLNLAVVVVLFLAFTAYGYQQGFLFGGRLIKDSGKNISDSSAKSDVNLVKLGEELHGPNDRMKINKSQILFTESLRDDSKVVKAIGNYKK